MGFIFVFGASFNTQPPEGGWDLGQQTMARCSCFNTQPPEGGWHYDLHFRAVYDDVSTHSRPKAAGVIASTFPPEEPVSTHSRPKAAGMVLGFGNAWRGLFQHTAARRRLGRNRDSGIRPIGFNTQPPEGGWSRARRRGCFWLSVSTHSRPKAAGVGIKVFRHTDVGFQHTAARRRLGSPFQHICVRHSFNTQPPEGGWQMISNN